MGVLRVRRDWRQGYWGAQSAAALDTWRRGYQDVLGCWGAEGCIRMSTMLGTEREGVGVLKMLGTRTWGLWGAMGYSGDGRWKCRHLQS